MTGIYSAGGPSRYFKKGSNKTTKDRIPILPTDNGPILAPAPGQTSPNLSRTPTIRAYVPSGRRLASDGLAGQRVVEGLTLGCLNVEKRNMERQNVERRALTLHLSKY